MINFTAVIKTRDIYVLLINLRLLISCQRAFMPHFHKYSTIEYNERKVII